MKEINNKKLNQDNKLFNFKKSKWFTLVELLIVITIIAILATIVFISFENYTKDARDANKASTLKNIQKWLILNEVKLGKYINPDSYITIGSWNVIYIKQWQVWYWVSNIISLNSNAVDSKDNVNYIYNVSWDNRKYQLWVYLEKNNSIYFSYIYKTYAEDNLDKYLYTLWDNLWIFTNKQDNLPLIKTDSFTWIDLSDHNISNEYTIYFSNSSSWWSFTSSSWSEIIEALYKNTWDNNWSNLWGETDVWGDEDNLNQQPISIWTVSSISQDEWIALNISMSWSFITPEWWTLKYSATWLPVWITINENTGIISWNLPLVISNTDYNIVVTVTNIVWWLTATQSFIITVKKIENTPIEQYTSNKLYAQWQSFTFDDLTWYVSSNKNVAYTKALTWELTKDDNILVFQNWTWQLLKWESAFILQTVNLWATTPFIYWTTYSNLKKWNELNVYSNNKDLRKQLYLDDKNILWDIFQWWRNDPVTYLSSTWTLYSWTWHLAWGIDLSSTPWGDWFILNPNWAWWFVYNWLKKTISNTDPSWWQWPCENGYKIPTWWANSEWSKIIDLVKDSIYTTYAEVSKLEIYLLIPMAWYRQYDTDNIWYYWQGHYANFWASNPSNSYVYGIWFNRVGTTYDISKNNHGPSSNWRNIRCMKN